MNNRFISKGEEVIIKKLDLYFLQNKDWYYFDAKNGMYKLTALATKEAIINYNEFYNLQTPSNML